MSFASSIGGKLVTVTTSSDKSGSEERSKRWPVNAKSQVRNTFP